jgi:K+-sensing histidine kinase KdpD
MAAPFANTAVVTLCRRDGTAIEVLFDTLGLPVGDRFEHFVSSFDRRKAVQFLAAAARQKGVLNRRLNVNTGSEVVPLYFSAAISGLTLVVIGTPKPYTATNRGASLATLASGHQRAVRVACRKLDALAEEGTRRSGHAHRVVSKRIGPSQLLRLFAHDLTNPISGILAASQFLLEDTGHLLDPDQWALLKSIEGSSQFTLRFIGDIIELHSMQSGKLDLRLQSTNLGALITRCVEELHAEARHRRIVFALAIPKELCILDVDCQHMCKAISAVIRNELACLEPGSSVSVALHSLTDRTEIEVSGGGGGLAKLSAASQPANGRQAGPSRSGINEIRTRLTLSAVSRIVEAHRGSLRKRHGPARGLAITIVLPAAVPPGQTRPPRRNRPKRKGDA